MFKGYMPLAFFNKFLGCSVPWRVDDDLIFFGPCKKLVRERLRKRFLCDISHTIPIEDIFIVGVNGSNKTQTRKIVWAGKISEIMTFAEADRHLAADRFQKLRKFHHSPLHVRPILKSGELVGYEHVSEEHRENDKWAFDLSRSARRTWHLEGRKLMLGPGQSFDRDCCMLLKNLFFADGQGIEFDEEVLEILQQAQPGKRIDDYAVFGRSANRRANGRRGSYLELEPDLTDRFVAWLSKSIVVLERRTNSP
jgi:hypothetical protein